MLTFTTSVWPVVILWIGLYQSLMLIPVLLSRQGRNTLANALLAGFVGLMGLRLAGLLMLLHGIDMDWLLPLNVAPPLGFLYGPLFYFYLRAFLERSFAFRPVHLWHLVPTFLALILKLWVLWPAPDQVLGQSHTPAQGIGWLFVGTRIIFGLVFLGYLITGLRLIWRFHRRVKEEASFSEAVHLRWMIFLATVLLLPVASAILTAAALGPPSPSVSIGRLAPYPAYGVSLMMAILAIVAMIRPEVLHGIPEALKVEEDEPLPPPRYESSALTERQKDKYLTQLQTYLREAQPYLNQELTLSSLAAQLGLNSKYLSQVINEKLGQNFLDFINSYRVARAQTLLRDPAYQHYTVVAIAHEVGFKSKSAFYTAFKKGTDTTPSAWRSGHVPPNT